ncbi:hypothetical protein, partial [Pseudomonas aeruginosa]|uniref:hypothetical protein n=1 Tax=Pseudomonas aeruginosa TaxID=287 RepID=UPI003CC52157
KKKQPTQNKPPQAKLKNQDKHVTQKYKPQNTPQQKPPRQTPQHHAPAHTQTLPRLAERIDADSADPIHHEADKVTVGLQPPLKRRG